MTLPDGTTLDLDRSRWDGVLRPEEVRACRELGIPLAYDCVQIGWIPAVLPDSDRVDESPRGGDEEWIDRAGRPDDEQREVALERRAERERAAFLREIDRRADERLDGRAAERVRAVAEAFDVGAADRCHWVLRTALAEALAPPGTDAPRSGTRTGAGHPGRHAHGDPPAEFSFRAWTPDDVEVYLRLLANPKVWEYLPEPYPDPLTEETARTLIEVGSFTFHHLPLAVEREGEPVGQCRLRFDPPLAGVRAAEVAYWLGEEFWGRGYMSRILPRFTEYAFRTQEVDVIYAWIHRDHEASRRVAERAGYRRDTFPLETELARRLDREEFIRFATFRAGGR